MICIDRNQCPSQQCVWTPFGYEILNNHPSGHPILFCKEFFEMSISGIKLKFFHLILNSHDIV